MLPGCLRRLDFVDEVVAIVDDRTLDRSVEILSNAGARVTMVNFEEVGGFGGMGNVGLTLRLAIGSFSLTPTSG